MSPEEHQALLTQITTHSEKKEYQAILDLLPDELLEKEQSALFYTWKGVVFWRLENAEKTLFYAEKAIQIDALLSFGWVLRGNGYATKKAWDKALEDYTKAIELDGDLHYPWRNKGDVYKELKKWQEALMHYQKAKSLDKEFYGSSLDSKIAECLEKIEEEKEFAEIEAPEDLKNEAKGLRLDLKKKINDIKTQAAAPDMDVVHYTGFEVAKSLASHQSACLWYSNVVYVNDPEEGKILLDILDDGKNKTFSQAYQSGESRTEVSVYLGSFLPAQKQGEEESHEDDLVMWRTYGKDSKGVEAGGCNLVLDGAFFKPVTEKPDLDAHTPNIPQSTGQELLRMMYYHKGKKELVGNATGIMEQINDLREILNNVLALRDKAENDSPGLARLLEEMLFKEVSKVAYLFKSADYAFENEVRVVAYIPKTSTQIQFRDQVVVGAPPVKFYIHSDNVVLPFLKKIYLGAKVPYASQWSIYLDQELRKTKEILKEDVRFKDFDPSQISIIKSSCQFV